MTQNVSIVKNTYKIVDKKYENFIYKEFDALDTRDNTSVIIKILNNAALSLRTENIIHYHNDLYTVSQIDHPSVHKILNFFEEETTYVLVHENFKGTNLQSYIQEKINFSIEETIDIIMQLAKALEVTHEKNIFHRHITAKDVLLIPSNGKMISTVKLTNIGFIHIIDITKISEFDDIMSIFPYISPEECGVLKRKITPSSDLYSLGILFYQLLTNHLPFTGLTISSIIHQHIAKVPQLPSSLNPQVPWILDSIIMKLLLKDPEKRYQSAKGLIKDLERLKSGKKDFLPGVEDEVIHLSYKTNLIGREKEFRSIKEKIVDIKNNNGGLCLITGKSGLGKSRLLEESRAYAFSKNISFIISKCFSGNNKTPYGPIKDILKNYLTIFNSYEVKKKERIQRIVRKEIKDLGQILLDFLPQLQTLIGEYPNLISLDNEKECKRFLLIISTLFHALSKAENGLIIAIDDMQWADEGTIEVISTILLEAKFFPFLIIGTYRHNEINEEHVVFHLIDKLDKRKVPILQIHCAPFNSRYMFVFISFLLHNKAENIKKISDLIHKKSGGNPFFALEILKHLITDKIIFYKEEKWNINWEIINSIEFPPTMLNMIMKRILLLEEVETTVLSHASVIGREFEINILFKVIPHNKEMIVKAVDRAIHLQLLESDPNIKLKIYFVHDRIREAFYTKLSDEKKQELHTRIAHALEDIHKPVDEDTLFQLAHHYIEGKEEKKIIEFAFPAGTKAMEKYAYSEAEKYLMHVIAILTRNKADQNDKLITAHKSLAEIYLITGKYDQSISLFNELLPLLKTHIEQAHIYRMITSAYFKKGDFKRCEEYGRIGLNILGEKLPVKKLSVTLGIMKELIIHLLHNIFPFLLKNEDKVNNVDQNIIVKYKLIISFYEHLNWMYVLSDIPKCVRSTLRMLNISENKIGKSKELGISLTFYAGICSSIPLFKRALKYHKKAMELRKEIGDEYGIAQSAQVIGYCYEWMGDYKTGSDYFTDSIARFKKISDIKEYGVSTLGKAECALYLSNYSDAQKFLQEYLNTAKKTNDQYAEINAEQNLSLLLFETGHMEDGEKKLINSYNRSFKKNIWILNCIAAIQMAFLYLEKNNIYKSQEYIEKALQIMKKTSLIPHYVANIYNAVAEAYIFEYLHFHSQQIKKSILNKINKGCRDALKKTAPWKTHYIGALRVMAKYCMLLNKNKKAEEYFYRSIKLGQQLDRKYELAKCFYEYGLFLKHIGKAVESKQKIEFAYKIFDDIHSIRLKEKISRELSGEIGPERFTPIVRLMDKQRFSSIIKVSQDICSILNPEELLDNVLLNAIEVVGAQGGYLFIKDNQTDELKIKVSQNIEETTIPEWIIETVNKIYLTEKTIITNGLHTNKSVICVPLLYKNETIGVCYLFNNLSHNIFSDEDKEVLEAIMTQAAISLVNARLYELATVDGLTKLYIRSHFQLLLQNELKRSKRYNHPCSLIMADIDHFKKVNDTYGHQFGDHVLYNTAKIIKANCRGTDIPARYGGEEFCIILPETNRQNAMIVANKIRTSVEEHIFIHLATQARVTISFGVAEFPYNASTEENLIEAADKALYISKESGRNRVTVYEQKIE